MTREITVDRDEIPEELKQRDQWLMWDIDAKKPRRPHWRGDFSVSWMDPNDWHSFEEAYEAIQETDTWGLGYVFAIGSDEYDGDYGALDLDGCVREDGGPKEWLPSLQPFVDAGCYIEFSPSGTGMHVPLEGFEKPEWWSNVHLTEEEHEGVEAYDKKFFTFTGDQLKNTENSVPEAGEWVENWLIEAYKGVTGEDPTETKSTSFDEAESGGRSSRDEFLDVDDIREALDYIDPDVDYATWRDIGFALTDHFTSKRRALSLFTEWSRGGRKWDNDAEKQAKRIIEDAGSNGQRTIGTVIYYARRGGWEMPSPTYSREAEEITDDEDDDDDSDGRLTNEDIWEIWSEKRLDGTINQSAHVPPEALRFIAEDRGYYDFESLEEEPEELPLKAHNRALWWVNERWAEENNVDEATERPFLHRTDVSRAFSWEDVRYIYDESKEDGRYAAVRLLRSQYAFLTPEDTEILHVYNQETGVFDSDLRYDIGRTLDRELLSHYSQHEKSEIIGRLKERTVKREELEAVQMDTNYVCVENGVLDVDDRELLPHDPKYKFTTYLPVEYDPDAEVERVDEFLDEITRREEDKQTLLEIAGNCLLPNYEYEKILILFGEGSNGKSTWFEIVRKFLGASSSAGAPTNVDSLTLQQITENRFATSSLVGKWANIGEDLPEKKIQDLGPLKDLTGGGETSVEPKGKERFSFHNRAKMMFAANRPPVLPERSTAVKRRLVPVHLPYKFTTNPDDDHKDAQKEGLIEELTDEQELSGLLNAALDGLDRLRDQGDVSLPETHDERLELYERFSDHIKAFRVDCLTNEGGSRILKDDIYNGYTNFCSERDREPVGKRTFWRQLRKTTLNVTEKRLSESVDEDRRRALDNVGWTDLGKDHAPEMASAGDPEKADEDADTIASISEGDQSVTVECRVEEGETDTPDAIAEKARVIDETAEIWVTVWSDASKPSIEEGACYRFKNVDVDVFDGEPYLGVENRSGVQEISAGVGNAPTEDPGPNSQITAADGGSETDGEEDELEGLNARLKARLTNYYEDGDEFEVPRMAGEMDVKPGRIEKALDHLSEHGKGVTSIGDGRYRVMR